MRRAVWHAFVLLPAFAFAQVDSPRTGDFHARIEFSEQREKVHAPAAVIWLVPKEGTPDVRPVSPGHFTLLQKNRMFSPHLLVIPTGSTVSFPNADPFFHNVFSLFNGKRFDLGLYESGTTKDVVFSREGISYIFCNIHPEMSAVIIALDNSLYGIADSSEAVSLRNVPQGDYALHIWVEGLSQSALDRLTRRIQIRAGSPNALTLDATNAARQPAEHLNKFGQQYEHQQNRPY